MTRIRPIVASIMNSSAQMASFCFPGYIACSLSGKPLNTPHYSGRGFRQQPRIQIHLPLVTLAHCIIAAGHDIHSAMGACPCTQTSCSGWPQAGQRSSGGADASKSSLCRSALICPWPPTCLSQTITKWLGITKFEYILDFSHFFFSQTISKSRNVSLCAGRISFSA